MCEALGWWQTKGQLRSDGQSGAEQMRREQRYQKAQDGGWRILLTDRGGQKRRSGWLATAGASLLARLLRFKAVVG